MQEETKDTIMKYGVLAFLLALIVVPLMMFIGIPFILRLVAYFVIGYHWNAKWEDIRNGIRYYLGW